MMNLTVNYISVNGNQSGIECGQHASWSTMLSLDGNESRGMHLCDSLIRQTLSGEIPNSASIWVCASLLKTAQQDAIFIDHQV
jgi:hypothetical protein